MTMNPWYHQSHTYLHVYRQAAGVAAAISAKLKTAPRNLNVRDVQSCLVEQKAVIFDSLMKRLRVKK
ncbi:MAG: hypothetical protein JRH18_07510 [Deltaproteobacteria bacterium]|nr:hypothetical protein [Deltaproteobacteria bacterium]MBW2151498.1 hypothetical protein [Deltaproteobacteria bacterium]